MPANPPAVRKDFEHYASLIAPRLKPEPFAPESESATALQAERGCVLPLAITHADPLFLTKAIDRVLELSTSPRLATLAIVDRSGHHRPVYRALLVYSCLQTFRLVYETLPRSEFGRWEEGLRPWCDLLESELGEIAWPSGPMPAGRGSSATEAAWMALALFVAGKIYIRDAWTDLASDLFGKLVRSQTETGSLLNATAADNPETWWYHELVLLHATGSYAVQAEDRNCAAAVARNTLFHQNETQPDHATSQPWGLFAFIWNPATRTLADQQLHNAQINSDPLNQILLADALHCLRLFL